MCVPTCEMDALVSAQGVCEVRQGNASHYGVKSDSLCSPPPLPHISAQWPSFPGACRVWAKWAEGLCWGQKPCGEGEGGRLPLGTSCLSSCPHGRPYIQAYGEEGGRAGDQAAQGLGQGWAGPSLIPAATLFEQVQLPDGQTALSALVELCSSGDAAHLTVNQHVRRALENRAGGERDRHVCC